MEVFKSYTEFVNESFFPDEISKLGKKAIGAIKKFMGKGAKFLNSLVYQSTGKISKDGREGTIPEGVYIFPSQSDIAALEKSGIDPVVPDLQSIYGEENTDKEVDEAVVPLESDPRSGVLNIHEDELKATITRSLRNPGRLPLMIWGAPGIAKTAIVQIAQKEYGGRLIDLQLTTYAPEDFFLPKEDADSIKRDNRYSSRATRIPQGWLPVYHESEGEEGDAKANGVDGQGGVLFLDELSRAREAIRNICLKLVHEKRMDGGWILGSKWRIIAASNRIADDPETNASEFGTALSNRFKNYNFVPTVQDLSKYALSLKDEQGADAVDPRIISFLNWPKGQEYMHKLDPDSQVVAWPSPRTWIEGGLEWKDEEKHLNRKLTVPEVKQIMSGYVGVPAAEALANYLTLSEKIDLDKLPLVYTDPENAPLPPTRSVGGEAAVEQDVAYIMASIIAYEHRNKRLTREQLENVFKYTVRVNNPTIAMQIIAALTELHPYINVGIQDTSGMTKDFVELTQQYFFPKYPGEARAMKTLLGGATAGQPTSFETQPPEQEEQEKDKVE